METNDQQSTLALVESNEFFQASNPMNTWLQLEQFVYEYQNRPLSERIRDKKRLLAQKWLQSAPIRLIFGRRQILTKNKLLEYRKESHRELVRELRALLGKIGEIAALSTNVAKLWTGISGENAAIHIDQAHCGFHEQAQNMFEHCIHLSALMYSNVARPLEGKLDKLLQLESFIELEIELELLVIAASQKLVKAQRQDKNVFQRQSELHIAQRNAERMSVDIVILLEWVDSMKAELIRNELDKFVACWSDFCATGLQTFQDRVMPISSK